MKCALRLFLIPVVALVCLPGCFGALGNKIGRKQKKKDIEATKAVGLTNFDTGPLSRLTIWAATSGALVMLMCVYRGFEFSTGSL